MLASKRLKDSVFAGSRIEERERREVIIEGRREDVMKRALGSSWFWD